MTGDAKRAAKFAPAVGALPLTAARVGRTVLANLAKGRAALREVNAARQAQGNFYRRIIADLVFLDIEAGHGRWGRAGRIQRKLRMMHRTVISLRMVNKYLAQLASGACLLSYGASNNYGGLTHEHEQTV